MRTIKFRGKKIKNGQWVIGYYILDPFGKSQILNNFTFYTVDKETVGQFTGLTDKNGKEIYEGDIVRYFCNEHGEIKFYHGAWVVMGKADYDSFDSLCGHIEIIGNIHDNQELLK